MSQVRETAVRDHRQSTDVNRPKYGLKPLVTRRTPALGGASGGSGTKPEVSRKLGTKVTPDPDDIAAFWKWFSANAEEIAKAALAADRGDVAATTIQELDERIGRLGPFSWEIGPGEHQPNAFVISPSGDHKQLSSTRAIVSTAPTVQGWQFYPAKPPRQWDYSFRLHSGTSSYDLNAANWRYVLVS
jgi:hypothetical protein